MKLVAISPQPSDDEAAAISAALAHVYATRAGESRAVRSRRSRELKLATTPELKLGSYGPASGRRLTWRETARREALDASV
jgi:hypothetical protein